MSEIEPRIQAMSNSELIAEIDKEAASWGNRISCVRIEYFIECVRRLRSPTAVPSAGLIGLLIDAEALLCDERAGKAANELAATIRASLPSPTRDANEPGELCSCGHHANEHINGGICDTCGDLSCQAYRPKRKERCPHGVAALNNCGECDGYRPVKTG